MPPMTVPFSDHDDAKAVLGNCSCPDIYKLCNEFTKHQYDLRIVYLLTKSLSRKRLANVYVNQKPKGSQNREPVLLQMGYL